MNSPNEHPERIELFGLGFDNVTMGELMDRFASAIAERQLIRIVTPNVDHLIKIQRDAEFLELNRTADLCVVDGMPIVWAARILGRPLKEKVSGSDFFREACRRAAENGWRIFLAGAAPGVAEEAASKLRERFGEIDFVGIVSPPIGFDKDAAACDELVESINAAKPDILFLALGTPKQEKWLYRHRERLDVPVAVGVGASFDFEAGRVRRAPRWMQRAGLEWFFRLLMQPRHLFKRYIIDDSKFLLLVWREWRRLRAQRKAAAR